MFSLFEKNQGAVLAKQEYPVIMVPGNAQLSDSKGGIDFNSDKINLEIQNHGDGIKFTIDLAMLEQLQNAPGFTPVIINIQPMSDLHLFLGINDNRNIPQTASI